ncbi:MAG: potassium transporter TrkG [Lachnospiraceae bacterium]
MNLRKKELSSTQVIMLGFLSVIFVGAFVLMLPICSAEGEITSFLTALFTATTSVCVTGLVVVDTFSYWSFFGQAVILILIQCGGLGVVTLSTYVLILLGRKIGLKHRLLLEDSLNLDTLTGLIKFIQKVFMGTLLIEGIGALCYMTVFVPEYGVLGIWMSVFNAVSAFCNAGMDVVGPLSLTEYVANPIINITTMVLIVLGGIGFVVWWDVIRVIKLRKNNEIMFHQVWHRLQFHSKVVISATVSFILIGFVVVLLLEWGNPETLGELSIPVKIQAALFQSITTRTAGFMTVSQSGLHDTTALVCMFLMFIGGSPVGTAGGIKTTTIAVLGIAVWSTIKGSNYTIAYNRRVNPVVVRKALAVTVISALALFCSLIMLLTFSEGEFIDIMYEAFSAIGTVGLSRGYTPSLSTVGRCVIIVAMYLGRTGPISLAMAFTNSVGKNKASIEYPEANITVG